MWRNAAVRLTYAPQDGDSIEVITNIVSSQAAIHTKYGGIVPELASRSHMEMIWPVVEEALDFTDVARALVARVSPRFLARTWLLCAATVFGCALVVLIISINCCTC